MQLPDSVRVVEVGPRDGLQNQPGLLSAAQKIDFINQLSSTGLSTIEATAFVSPRWIPQLADHAEVYAGILKQTGVSYPVLIPNLKGLDEAFKVNVREIAVFTAASETFSNKNTNCSIAESLERICAILQPAKAKQTRVRGYISCVAGCPYEGPVPAERVATLTQTLFELGCDEVSLGDTIGTGTPLSIERLLQTIANKTGLDRIAVHFHDTYGQALANILIALQMGVKVIDSSVAGLGGCPYAKGATGNVATEDVVYMLKGLGIETGIDLEKLVRIGRTVCGWLKQPVRSRVSEAMA